MVAIRQLLLVVVTISVWQTIIAVPVSVGRPKTAIHESHYDLGCREGCEILDRHAVQTGCTDRAPASQCPCLCASRHRGSSEAVAGATAAAAADSEFCNLERDICKDLCGNGEAVFTCAAEGTH